MIYLKQYPFIFSDERRYRIRRHVIFWTAWWLFLGFLYAFIPVTRGMGYLQTLPRSMLNSLIFIPVHMFLAYSLMYFVIPVYVVREKYKMAVFSSIILVFATASLSAGISIYLLALFQNLILPQKFVLPFSNSSTPQTKFFLSLMAGLRGSFTIGGLAAAIKLMKHWHVEGQRNLQLQKENVESQLQVLKAQVHPHFLFNTLNNIYSYTQNTSQTASKLVVGLSEILRYMLYEGSQPLVPLSKELSMIDEYINLEKIRYGNKFELHTNLPQNTRDLYIAPLLLLPFVENCFKHGISTILDHPWMNLDISFYENTMSMKLLNSKPSTDLSSHHLGIGIENVRRRLSLLYPNKHELVINNEEEVFIVNLKIELEKSKTVLIPVTQTPMISAHA